MKVTLTPKDSTVKICNQTFLLEKDTVNFLEKINVEVMKNPKSKQDLLKNLTQTCTRYASMFVILPTTDYLVPPDITDSFHKAIAALAVIGVGTAFITLMIAGIWKMLNGKRSDEWMINIVKGLGQVLGAPIIVALIVGVFMLLFSNVPAFMPVVSPIGEFFKR